MESDKGNLSWNFDMKTCHWQIIFMFLSSSSEIIPRYFALKSFGDKWVRVALELVKP